MPEDTREETDKEQDEGYQDLEEEVQGEKQNQGTETEGREELQDCVAELEEELTDKEETIQELRDRVRHLKADFENYKKRQQEKKEEEIEKEKGKVIMDIVPIYDNLDRAFKSFEKNDDKDSFIEGVEKIYAQFDEFLSKREVELIKAEGEKFDPNKHQALMRVETDEHEHNEITEEFERGYKYKDKVLKPSKVKVNIKSSGSEDQNDDE